LFLKRTYPHLQQYDKEGWKIIAKEFKKTYQVSKKQCELKEQFNLLEGIISTNELSEEEKNIMVQNRRKGKTFSYIAQQLHRKENTIKNYYHRKYKRENKQESVENF
jgi:DNA-binding NarL/FixJ family response regulator